MTSPTTGPQTGWPLLRQSPFRNFILSRLCVMGAHQMMLIALFQHVYEVSKDPLKLGYVGLMVFLAKLFFLIPGGLVADRLSRKKILIVARFLLILLGIGMLVSLFCFPLNLHLVYGFLFLIGSCYSFDGPAIHAMVPDLVAAEDFHHAAAWSASAIQCASVAGPAVGGLLYAAVGVYGVLIVVTLLRIVSLLLMVFVRYEQKHKVSGVWKPDMIFEGLSFVWKKKILLGALSLDLFAVLLGGVIALLPIYANEILHVGAWGLGFLRASQAVGAVAVALWIAGSSPIQKKGEALFWGVIGFGVATLCFALSKNFWFSMAALAAAGGADMISMVVRSVLVQQETPVEMRGRVSAVNLVFIGASNELGEFESGLTAKCFGTVPAALIGGLGTLGIVLLWRRIFPDLFRYKDSPTSP